MGGHSGTAQMIADALLKPRQRASDPVHAAASVSARVTAVAIRSRR
jgi:hypothetical protein